MFIKPRPVSIILGITLIAFGCSKNSEEVRETAADKSELIENERVNKINQVSSIAYESNTQKRSNLLLKNMIEPLDSNNAGQIIDLHHNKKFNNEEFRSLFWNSSLSRELIEELSLKLAEDSLLSQLDKTLIQSISKQNVSFDELLNDLKSDNADRLPVTFQNALLDEFIVIYHRDFDSINSDSNSLHDRLTLNDGSQTEQFLRQLKKFLELHYLKRLLETKSLVTPRHLSEYNHREIKTNFNLDYRYQIGRCGTFGSPIKNFTNLDNNLGLQCQTETPSVVNLDVSNKISTLYGSTNIDLLVHRFVRGGYDRGKKENATSILNYGLSGQIIIPKCSNPSFCNQLFTVSVMDFGRVFTGANLTDEGVAITVNGAPLSNKFGTQAILDISKNDALINISLTGSQKHIGACCFNSATFQKINLTISPTYSFAHQPIDRKKLIAFNTFNERGFFMAYPLPEIELNLPNMQTLLLERQIKETLKNKATSDDYRLLLYNSLAINQMYLDNALLTNSSPNDILNYRQLQSAMSDRIGRGIILPLIHNKIFSLDNAYTLNLKNNINEMLKTILLANMEAELKKDEAVQIINSTSLNLNAEAKEMTTLLLESIESNITDQKAMLDEIANFQSEFALIFKKASLERQVLNLELAQFTETSPTPNGSRK